MTSPAAIRASRPTAVVSASVGGLIAAISLTAHLWATGHQVAIPAHLLMAAVGARLAIVDLVEHRLPNRLTLGVLAPLAVLLVIASVAERQLGALVVALVAALASGAFHLFVAMVLPSGLGFGDVKLSLSLGGLLGWWSMSTAVSGVFLSFLVGGLAALTLLATGRATRRSAVPFGPSMLVGAWWAVLLV